MKYAARLLMFLLICAWVHHDASAQDPDDGRVRLYVRCPAQDGGKLFFIWKQLEGPSAKIADPNAGVRTIIDGQEKWVSETSFVPTEPGRYVFEVSVKNENGDESKRTFVQEVLPAAPPPVASAGKDQADKLVDEQVVINGSDSHAAPGRNIAEWQWREVQVPPAFKLDPKWLKERKFEFKAPSAGVYQFELKVSDGLHWSKPSLVTVTVGNVTPPPIAVAGKDQDGKNTGDTIVIDGSASKAAPGEAITEWSWHIVQAPDKFHPDPNILKQPKFEFQAMDQGAYQFELKVFDGKHWSEGSRVMAAVAAATPPPIAVAGEDQDKKVVGDLVVVNGIGSKAADGREIAEWQWQVTDAPEKFKPDPKVLKTPKFDFKATEPGVYQFELKVSDGKHWSEPAHMRVTVKPFLPKPVVDGDPTPKPVELPGRPEDREPLKEIVIKPIVARGGTVKLGDSIVLDGSASVVDEAVRPEFFWKQTSGKLLRPLTPDKARPFVKDRGDLLNYPVWTAKPKEPGEYSFVLEIGAANPVNKNKPIKVESEPVVFSVPSSEPVPVPVPTPEPAVTPKSASAPVAHVSVARREVEVGDMVKLDGSKSTDPEGAKLTFFWGPVPPKPFPKTWTGTDGPLVQFKAEAEGEYTVALVVDNGKQKSEPELVAILVGPANQPPVVKLKESFECVTGEELHIRAEVSDPENDRVEITWSCVDPAALKIPDRLAKNAELVFKPKTPGAYVFKIEVVDAKGHKVSAQTMVGVKEAINRPPTALIDGPKNVNVGQKVKISGERSSDPEKQPLTYFWKQETDATGPSLGTPPGEHAKIWECTPTQAGHYVVSLIVSDGVNKSEPDRIEFTVAVQNNPPVANILAPAGGRVIVGEQVILDGSASSDPDPNDKLTFKWRKVEGKGEIELSGVDKSKLNVKGLTPGPVRIELIVNDGLADSEAALVDLIVAHPNAKPIAHITGPETAPLGGQVDLSAAESAAADGGELSYVWAQSEGGGPDIKARGPELRKRTLRFKTERPGTYVFTLVVVDSDGNRSDPYTQKVMVKGLTHAPRCVASVMSKGPYLVNAEVKLTTRGSLDPDGSKVTFRWKQLSGDPVQLPDAPTDADVVNVVPPAIGKYEFECIANDGESDSAPARVSFIVQPPHQGPAAVISEVVPAEVGERISLDGNSSRVGEGDKLKEFRWTQVSGPKVNFGFHGERKPKVDVVLPKEGEYVFELKVFDGREWSEPSKVATKTRAPNVAPAAAVVNAEVRTEEHAETVLDATPSTDPDNGPRPLTFIWRQLDGARVELHTEGALAKFTPTKAGSMTFQVEAFDGKARSTPVSVAVTVMPQGSTPVAVPVADPNPAKTARRAVKTDLSVILDGTRSSPRNRALTYSWKQVGGDDLGLPAAALAKDRVGLRIYHPGAYRFSLVVSDGQMTSQSGFIDFNVVEYSAEQAPSGAGDGRKKDPTDPKPQSFKAPAHPDDSQHARANDTQRTTPQETQREGALLPAPKDSTAVAATANTRSDKPVSDIEAKNFDGAARSPAPTAESELIQALSNPDKDIRSAAAAALYRRGIGSIPALIGVLDGDDKLAHVEARWALEELSHESFGLDAAKWKTWWAEQEAVRNSSLPVKE